MNGSCLQARLVGHGDQGGCGHPVGEIDMGGAQSIDVQVDAMTPGDTDQGPQRGCPGLLIMHTVKSSLVSLMAPFLRAPPGENSRERPPFYFGAPGTLPWRPG